MKKLMYPLFTVSLLISCSSFAMDNETIDSHFSFNQPIQQKDILFEKQDEINQMIKEYHTKGTPISLAVACGSTEMPNKIKNEFKSLAPAKEQWLALDLLLTDKDKYRSGPHIRMDAMNVYHWSQLANYLKEQKVEVETIAFTAFGPGINSDLLKETIMPMVKKGGQLVWPSYFPTDTGHNKSADIQGVGDIWFQGSVLMTDYTLTNEDGRYINKGCFFDNLKDYHFPEGKFYNNKEALFEATLEWIRKDQNKAKREFAAKSYVNRIVSFDPKKITDLLNYKIRRRNDPNASFLFLKTPEEFTKDYIEYFREYMTEIGYDESSFKIYSHAFPNEFTKENQAELFGVEEYNYPKDGTFDLAGYGRPSLVLFKK
jgi:hypothetical protein